MGFAAKKTFAKVLFTADEASYVVKDVPIRDWRDEELMSAYQNGDVQAFQVLLARHQRPLFNYLFRFLKNHEAAEEAFQEVFLRLIRSRKDYKPSAKFTTWLYTLARHYCIDQIRKKKFHEHASFEDETDKVHLTAAEIESFSDAASAHDLSSAKQLTQQLNAILTELSSEQREVFVLRELQGLAFEDIANVTRVSVNTVKSRMRYALQFLQKRFQESGVTPGEN